MKYFQKSADLGNSDGMVNYGIALSEGYNGTTNLSEAMKYFQMSLDLGNPIGQILYRLNISIYSSEHNEVYITLL
jgi:TPR repeat protein